MSMSADGKIASANRAVTTFGSARDLAGLYALRATADAVICGARTIAETNATLGNGPARYGRARLRAGLRPHPVRVVATGRALIGLDLPFWEAAAGPIVAVTLASAPEERRAALQARGAEVWEYPGPKVDWPSALARLGRDHGVRTAVSEGGGALNEALLRAELVDEIRLTICPLLLWGAEAPTVVEGEGFETLGLAAAFVRVACRRAGGELFVTYRRR